MAIAPVLKTERTERLWGFESSAFRHFTRIARIGKRELNIKQQEKTNDR